MIKRRLNLLFLFLILQSCTPTQTFDKAKLDSFFAAINTHDENMGSIAIAYNGSVTYQNAIGYSEVTNDSKTAATIKTKYRIGSISKMFTATMILQLIEEGKLSLKTSLASYFPQLPNAAKITIAEMLNHRSGLHNFTSDSLYTKYMTMPKSEAEMLAIFARQKPDFEPNEKFEYSNTNYVLLGYIIEKLTGKTYAEELQKRITSKLSLTNTYYGTKTNSANNKAHSYHYTGKWTQTPETDMSIPGGAGAIISTPTDLVKFINALFAGKLTSRASLKLMKTMKDNYGMGMIMIPFYDKKGYGHTGGIDGFSSALIYFPEDKLAIAYTSNGIRCTTFDVITGALSIYFNRPFAIPEFKSIKLNTANLDKYVGIYGSKQIPLKIAVTKKNTQLFAQGTGQTVFPLEPKGEDKFSYSGIIFQFVPAKRTLVVTQGTKYLFTKIN